MGLGLHDDDACFVEQIEREEYDGEGEWVAGGSDEGCS